MQVNLLLFWQKVVILQPKHNIMLEITIKERKRYYVWNRIYLQYSGANS